MRLGELLQRLQDTTAEIRVRLAVALLVAFVALATRFGLESILGAFLAGAVVSLVDRDSSSHPHFRTKLEAIGYGFVVPVFFVSSGIRLDLTGLMHSPSALARVPVFLLALLVVRGVPALLGLRALGARPTVAVGAAAGDVAAVPGHRDADRAGAGQDLPGHRGRRGVRRAAVGADLSAGGPRPAETCSAARGRSAERQARKAPAVDRVRRAKGCRG